MPRSSRLLLNLALLAPATALWAVGGSTQDGAVTLTYAANHWSGTPGASFTGTESTPAADVVFETGWWYRVNGVDTSEHPFPPPDAEHWGSAGTFLGEWSDVDGKGFAAQEVVRVIDNEGPSGTIGSLLSLKNLTAVPLSITLFHYLDAEVGGGSLGDTGSLAANGFIKLVDGASVVRYRAFNATHFQVAPAASLRIELNDAGVDDLNDTGLPFAPGDVTAAFQFESDLPPGMTTYITQGNVSVSSRVGRDQVKGDQELLLQNYPAIWFQDSDAAVTKYWIMRRTQVFGAGSGGFGPAGRRLVGADDFDGDLTTDLVGQDPSTGEVFIDYQALTGAPVLAQNWKLSATGDFDADGRADILWRNTGSQKLVIWTMNGVQKVGNVIPDPAQAVDANWEVAAAVDFDGDGHRDLLWYNQTSGKLVIWRMDAAVHRISGSFTTPSGVGNNNWRALAAGDWGKGQSVEAQAVPGSQDILWQNQTSGKVVVWHMNLAGQRTSGVFTSPDGMGAGWTVAGPR